MSKTIKGQNLRLFIGGEVVAAAKSCKLNYSNEYEDSTTKDTPTGKKEEEFTRCNISISFDFLVGDLAALNALKAKMKAGASVAYSVEHTSGTNNDQKASPAEVLESGYAKFDSFDIDATDRQNVSASGSMHDVYETGASGDKLYKPLVEVGENKVIIPVTGLTVGKSYTVHADSVVGANLEVESSHDGATRQFSASDPNVGFSFTANDKTLVLTFTCDASASVKKSAIVGLKVY